MPLRRNHSGFTLIELLVVMAVIGLLAAIAIVSFNAARKRAYISQGLATARAIVPMLASCQQSDGDIVADYDVDGSGNVTTLHLCGEAGIVIGQGKSICSKDYTIGAPPPLIKAGDLRWPIVLPSWDYGASSPICHQNKNAGTFDFSMRRNAVGQPCFVTCSESNCQTSGAGC